MADIFGFSTALQQLSDRAAATGELDTLSRIRSEAQSIPFLPNTFYPKPWGMAPQGVAGFPGHPNNQAQPWGALAYRPGVNVSASPALGPQMGMQDMGNWSDPRGALAQVMPQDQPQQPQNHVSPANVSQPNTGTQQPSMGTDPIAEAKHAAASQDSDAWRWGLIAAGLGILANNSGHYGAAGPAIGKGGMVGMQTYLGLKENEQQQALKKQQMAQTKDYQDRSLGLQERGVKVHEDELNAKLARIKAMGAAAKSMPIVQENPNLLAMADIAPEEVFKVAIENAKPGEFEKLMATAGIQKGSQEWSQHAQDYIRKHTQFAPPISITNIPAAAEKAGMVELAKNEAGRVNEWGKHADAASQALIPITRMEHAVNNNTTYSGFLAPYQKELANLLSSVGVPVDKDRLASSEEYESQMAQWVRNNIKALGSGTAISNVDLAFTQNSGPAMRNSLAGKKTMLKAMRADLEWIQSESRRVNQYFHEHNGTLNGYTPTQPQIIQELQEGGSSGGNGSVPSIRDIMRRK